MASLHSGASPEARAPGSAGVGLILLAVAALLSAALLLFALHDALIAGAFGAGVMALGGLLTVRSRLASPMAIAPAAAPMDVSLLRAALDASDTAVAITDGEDRLVCANGTYRQWFSGFVAPVDLPSTEMEPGLLGNAAVTARRDGAATASWQQDGQSIRAELSREGADGCQLVWRFARTDDEDFSTEARRLLGGEAGRRLGEAGVMAVLAAASGEMLAANSVFLRRSTGDAQGTASGALVNLLATSDEGQLQFIREGRGASPLRIIQIPVDDGREPMSLFLLLDDTSGALSRLGKEEAANLNALLDMLPLGLALVNVDGRFVYLNKAFRKGAGLAKDVTPVYPGDLVVNEDKAPVSDLVHRFARGPTAASDIAVRLQARPEEPVALTVAGVRGLGEAAVLLSLKDNSEEVRLKRQVAQATKMQAVGQLAGGVAHDFNNILTAIIGHCDLMLMRHTPGDSDYDDIQQIRSNSNRAAGLTRQLLAFSRQQTLRPQVLQMPDVISEVSHLLKRLLGETTTLQVKHGRSLGAVRADPGQLEQVIVNLAVNARDAMPHGGTLTLHTFSVSASDVRQMASDILPIADYTALRVSDTGTGIPPHLIGKIFEPFFTTKEVGKGTGLGLSTVYGIVKQSGGFIFAESEPGKGTSFTIYLPVHHAETEKEKQKGKEKVVEAELWGSGTILLVEDETMVRAVAERALTRHGYTVLTAENGEAALEILANVENVDLMISDVVMPTMDGPTTVREARKTRPELPILFISGYAEEQLRKSIDFERVAFLAKPFSVQKLAEAARDALQAK